MSGVGDGRAEHQRQHGTQVPGDGQSGQAPPPTQVAGTGEPDARTPLAALRRRARRGDTAAVAELAQRGVTYRRGSVAEGRQAHARVYPPAEAADD